MEYFAPTTIDEAARLLAAPDARALAGGQSLMAMMNLELAAPTRLVSLRRIAGLDRIAPRADGGLTIGAMVTHAALAAMQPAMPGPRLLASAARVVAYPAVRNQGTIGGAVAHADPAADYPAVLVAANATLQTNTRRIAAADFFRGIFETALLPGEIVTAIDLPPGAGKAGYEKLSLVAGDFAIATIAVIAGAELRVTVGGCAPKPVLAVAPTIDAVLAHLDTAIDPPDDNRASAAYRRRVVPALVRRAVEASA